MPRFRYQATDADDQPVKEGTIEAENRYVAVARLLQDGLHVKELEEILGPSGKEAAGEEVPVEEVLEPDAVWIAEDQRIAVVDGMADVVRGGLWRPSRVDSNRASRSTKPSPDKSTSSHVT